MPDPTTWLYLPLLIFVARIIDVSLGTLRIIFVARGYRRLAPILGFVEVFIWIVVVSQITSRADNVVAYFGYAAGFAAGNYAGMWIESRLAMGSVVVRVILQQGGPEMVALLHDAGYGVTTVDGRGYKGAVQLIYTVVKRKNLPEVVGLIHNAHPKAFITVEEARSVEQGIFPSAPKGRQIALAQRKGK